MTAETPKFSPQHLELALEDVAAHKDNLELMAREAGLFTNGDWLWIRPVGGLG